MKALLLKEDKSLVLANLDKPKIGTKEVLVAIKASALNHRELWIQKGLYPGMTLPCILGADGAGVVKEIGEDVDAKWLNKEVIIYPAYDWGSEEEYPTRNFRVLGMPDPGTIAEYIKVPVESLFVKPSYLSFEEAAAVPVAGLTAWRALVRHGQIKANKKVLITGIGGGVAQAGLAIAKAKGAQVYVTSSSKKKIENAIELGASGGVNYRDPDWNIQLKELAGKIDIVLDSSPSPILDDYFKFMNYGGRIVTYGSTGSPKTSISISKFFLRHIQFIGTAMGSPREFSQLLEFMDEHKIKPTVHASYSLNNALDAIEALKEGNHIGKIIIRNS
jgi:NADPH:quinone reductase-like Zn-dependent oxidoreductase